MSVVKNLVSGIVDYAGLFPPATLSLEQTVGNFSRYLDSEYAWMLARLILPVDRLEDFEQIDSFVESNSNWRISALVPPVGAPNKAFEQALKSIVLFNQRHAENHQPYAIVDSIEIRAPTVADVRATIAGMPNELNVFLEIPHAQDPTELLEQIRQSGNNAFAKVRTGGITLDLIPSEFEVARFISVCARLDVGFKATAGLHHPMQGQYPLTYARNPEFGMMFGFLNVFVAACFAFSKNVSMEVIQAMLLESDSRAFVVSDQTLKWRDFEISAGDICKTRTQKAISFGSCSFDEPTTELEQLGWLQGVESA